VGESRREGPRGKADVQGHPKGTTQEKKAETEKQTYILGKKKTKDGPSQQEVPELQKNKSTEWPRGTRPRKHKRRVEVKRPKKTKKPKKRGVKNEVPYPRGGGKELEFRSEECPASGRYKGKTVTKKTPKLGPKQYLTTQLNKNASSNVGGTAGTGGDKSKKRND